MLGYFYAVPLPKAHSILLINVLVHFHENPFFNFNSNIVIFQVCDILSHQQWGDRYLQISVL